MQGEVAGLLSAACSPTAGRLPQSPSSALSLTPVHSPPQASALSAASPSPAHLSSQITRSPLSRPPPPPQSAPPHSIPPTLLLPSIPGSFRDTGLLPPRSASLPAHPGLLRLHQHLSTPRSHTGTPSPQTPGNLSRRQQNLFLPSPHPHERMKPYILMPPVGFSPPPGSPHRKPWEVEEGAERLS